jgi:RsiW-degrading membrane proteinase PrsW (M82 family)
MNNEVLLIFIATFTPSLAWLGYFYLRDEFGREPLHLVLMVFGGGLLAGPISLGLFHLIEMTAFYRDIEWIHEASILKQAVYCFLAIGPIEELSKFIAVWIFVDRKHIAFNSPLDGMVYAAAAALGFATIENWYFMLEAEEPMWALAVTRPFNHVLFASFWGFALGTSRFKPHHRGLVYKGLLLSMVYHGLYDYIVVTDVVPYLCSFFLVIVLWLWFSVASRHLMEMTLQKNRE